jgi:hypothetical protein
MMPYQPKLLSVSLSEDSTPTQQYGEHGQLVDAGVWLSDESSVSTLSHSVKDLLGFDENWLDDEDDFLIYLG